MSTTSTGEDIRHKIKKTQRRQYTQYLVKWKNRSVTKAIWMDEKQISKHGSSLQHLISSGLEIHSTGGYAAVVGHTNATGTQMVENTTGNV